MTQIYSCIKTNQSYFMTQNVIYHIYCPFMLVWMVYDSVSQTLLLPKHFLACKIVNPLLKQELAGMKRT